MVIPGTTWQIPLIKRIKEKGYRALVVHPTKDGDALPYADEIEYADILNNEACLSIAKKHQVKAIMSDVRMRPVSRGNLRRATWVGPQAERPRFPGLNLIE